MQRSSARDLYVPLVEVKSSDSAGELKVKGLYSPTWKVVLYVVLCIVTAGIFFLLTRWILSLRVKFLFSETSYEKADHVLTQDTSVNDMADEASSFLEKVDTAPNGRRFFVHKGLRYVYDSDKESFSCFSFSYAGSSFANLHQQAVPLSDDRREQLFGLCGPNKMQVPMPTVVELLVDELLHPFYVFQIVSVTIWILQFYFIYASCIFVLATAALIFSVVQTRRNNQALHAMADHSCGVNILREGGKTVMVDSKQIVPGDVVILEQSASSLVCDMVLLEGECVVSESSLTGESVPVVKTSLPHHQSASDPSFDINVHSRHVLFSGTEMRRVKGRSRALVLRTGFQTSKGELIRQILYPKPSVFQFYRDALIFIGVLFVITLGLFGWAVWKFVTNGATWWFTTLRVLDLFTTVIPPALPIAMSAGASFAVLRLRQGGIFCVVPKVVNVAGRVNIFCFDKTGTLTQDHLDVHCLRPSQSGSFQTETTKLAECPELFNWTMACCHSVVRLSNSDLIGDPLEVKMMEFSGWACSDFDEAQHVMTSPDKSVRVHIVTRHEFLSQLSRMSVIVRAPDGRHLVLAKGAPEEIAKHCLVDSLPANFAAILASYTAKGMRTIAFAARSVSGGEDFTNREVSESRLSFLGLLVMENALKAESRGLISLLDSAKVRSVMITGDNLLTAAHVAKAALIAKTPTIRLIEVDDDNRLSSSILSHQSISSKSIVSWMEIAHSLDSEQDLAMTGAAFSNLEQERLATLENQLILRRCTVFARANPLQKTAIVVQLKDGGKNTVGMCGDGANDCGALKAADCGLSISDGEAAVAAPFSGKTVTSVDTLLREGRGALATSFSLFKFMIMYSMIQTSSVLTCYVFLNLLADLQFLWVDLFLILPLSFAMGLARPSDRLADIRPPPTLFRLSVLLSLIGHILSMVAVLALVSWWAQLQPFVTPANQPTTLVNGTTPFLSVAVSVVFLFGNFLYVDYAFVFSIGMPFRQPFYNNLALLMALFVATACNIVWLFVQTPAIISFWSIVIMPYDFLGAMFGVVVAFFLYAYVFEVICIRIVQQAEGAKENQPNF